MGTRRLLMLCIAIMPALGGCPATLPVAAKCPPFPKPPAELMQDPPTLDLVPPEQRPPNRTKSAGSAMSLSSGAR